MGAKKKRRTGEEWIGGLGSLPSVVTGEGAHYRPDALLWLADGKVVGHVVGRPGDVLAAAAQSLRDTIARPNVGPPRAPGRVRVASRELADALRAELAEIDVLCAPTPEIDEVLRSMRERLGGDAVEPSYLSSGLDPEAVGAFFRATAALFRAAPWATVPAGRGLVSVTSEALDLRDAVLSVLGQMGQSRGFIVFPGIDEHDAYVEAADAMEDGEPPEVPPHFGMSFDGPEEVGPTACAEVATHRWELADRDAYPWILAFDEDMVSRDGSARELRIAEAVARALPQLLEEKKALLAAWDGGAPVERTLHVPTHGGAVAVTLRVPVERQPPIGLLADLLELELEGDADEIDEDARGPIEDELVERFAGSPEGKGLPGLGACRLVMDFAASHFGATIATLGPRELREIVLDVIPRKVAVDAAEAPSIIQELRAFYAFLGREFALHQAGACLRILSDDTAEQLAEVLADTSRYGLAKSFLTSAPLGPTTSPVPRAVARARKDKRKAARKARKKNR